MKITNSCDTAELIIENQLRKIEELTLYIIQQDKELKSLKREIEELKTLIKGK